MFSSSGKKGKKPSAKSGFNKAAAEALFDSLVDDPDDPDVLSMEGISTLCDQLNLDPGSDVRVLVLLWKLGAISKPGHVMKGEFIAGCEKMNASSIEELTALLPTLDPGFLDRAEFREFYKYVFQFSREGTNKTIERDIIMGLLPIVVDTDRAPHLNLFLEFLGSPEAEAAHSRITMDQWDSFLQFNLQVPVDLDGFEDDGACTYSYVTRARTYSTSI